MHCSVATHTWEGLEDLRPLLVAYLTPRCRDAHELDDIVQETLLRAARYRPSLADSKRLEAWTLRIAANVLRDHIRRERRFPRIEETDSVLELCEGREHPPEERAESVQLRLGTSVLEKELALRHLDVAMLRLRREDRTVLGSYYAGDGRCAETARTCAISPPLVKVRLFRARRRLLRVLERSLAQECCDAAQVWAVELRRRPRGLVDPCDPTSSTGARCATGLRS